MKPPCLHSRGLPHALGPLIFPPLGAGGFRTDGCPEGLLQTGSFEVLVLPGLLGSTGPSHPGPTQADPSPSRTDAWSGQGTQVPGESAVLDQNQHPQAPRPPPAPHSALHSLNPVGCRAVVTGSLQPPELLCASGPAAGQALQGAGATRLGGGGGHAGRALGEQLGGAHAGSGPSCRT